MKHVNRIIKRIYMQYKKHKKQIFNNNFFLIKAKFTITL